MKNFRKREFKNSKKILKKTQMHLKVYELILHGKEKISLGNK